MQDREAEAHFTRRRIAGLWRVDLWGAADSTAISFDDRFSLAHYAHYHGGSTAVRLTRDNDRLVGAVSRAPAGTRQIDLTVRPIAGPPLLGLMLMESLAVLPTGNLRLPILDLDIGRVTMRDFVSGGSERLSTSAGDFSTVVFDDTVDKVRYWLRDVAPHVLIRMDRTRDAMSYQLARIDAALATSAASQSQLVRASGEGYTVFAPTEEEAHRAQPAVASALSMFRSMAGRPAGRVAVVLYANDADRMLHDDASHRAAGESVLRWPARRSDELVDARTISHELTHHLWRTTFATTLPAWFDEGIAQYAESRGVLEDVMPVLKRYRGAFTPFSTLLADAHPASDAQGKASMGEVQQLTQRLTDASAIRAAALFYPESFAFLRFLVERNGDGILPCLAESFAKRNANEQAILRCTAGHLTLQQMEAQWLQWIEAKLGTDDYRGPTTRVEPR